MSSSAGGGAVRRVGVEYAESDVTAAGVMRFPSSVLTRLLSSSGRISGNSSSSSGGGCCRIVLNRETRNPVRLVIGEDSFNIECTSTAPRQPQLQALSGAESEGGIGTEDIIRMDQAGRGVYVGGAKYSLMVLQKEDNLPKARPSVLNIAGHRGIFSESSVRYHESRSRTQVLDNPVVSPAASLLGSRTGTAVSLMTGLPGPRTRAEAPALRTATSANQKQLKKTQTKGVAPSQQQRTKSMKTLLASLPAAEISTTPSTQIEDATRKRRKSAISTPKERTIVNPAVATIKSSSRSSASSSNDELERPISSSPGISDQQQQFKSSSASSEANSDSHMTEDTTNEKTTVTKKRQRKIFPSNEEEIVDNEAPLENLEEENENSDGDDDNNNHGEEEDFDVEKELVIVPNKECFRRLKKRARGLEADMEELRRTLKLRRSHFLNLAITKAVENSSSSSSSSSNEANNEAQKYFIEVLEPTRVKVANAKSNLQKARDMIQFCIDCHQEIQALRAARRFQSSLSR